MGEIGVKYDHAFMLSIWIKLRKRGIIGYASNLDAQFNCQDTCNQNMSAFCICIPNGN